MNRRHAIPLLIITLAGPVAASALPPILQACNDYHCDIRRPARLSPEQWQTLQQLLSDTTSPDQERQRVGIAIARLEQWVGEQTGSWRDLPRNQGDGSEAGQLDCIAESINTTTYLRLMTRHNLLKWHRAGAREQRSTWIFNTHWTATIQETTTGRRFAVDSWFFGNGKPPVILPLETWLNGQENIQNQP